MVVWQLSHWPVVWMCLPGLPVAWLPLWQLEQVPDTLLWLKRAGVQALVAWQVSHWAVVWMWFADLPLAVVPLWQLLQVPDRLA